MSSVRTGEPDCGCCAGVDAVTPRRIANPPGQPAIAYRVGRHGDFLESMRARLSSAAAPALAALGTREASDFTLAIGDALASTLDVLSFYTERVANEHYLRTATERLSVREMARLIGYQLAPGVAAGTHLAFTLQGVPGVPVEPITIPSGTRVQSVPGQDEAAQSFETVADAPARAEWNAIPVQQDVARTPAFGDTSLWLSGIDSGLSPGDLLLIVGSEVEAAPAGERWDVRVLTAVEPFPTRGLTRLRWERGLGHTKPFVLPAGEGVQLFTFRKRTAVFGSAAPDWRALSDDMKADYIGLASAGELNRPGDTEEWPDFSVLAPVYPERRTAGGGSFDQILQAATIDEVAAAASAAAQGAVVVSMQQATQAGAGVIAAGGQLAQSAMGFARQSAEGLNEVLRLGIDDVTQRARSLIAGQGQALQALQLSASGLVNHLALGHARQLIGDRIAGLPQTLSAFAANGLTEPVAIARAVLADLQAALADAVPATVLPDLQPVWDEALSAVRSAVGNVEQELDDDASPPGWLSIGADAAESAGSALTRVGNALDGLDLDAGAPGQTAATIVQQVVGKLKDAIGEHFSAEHFSELLDPSALGGNVQGWASSLFDAGGSVGQSLLDLQKTIVEAAGVEFSRLGMELGRIAGQARQGIADTAQLLNPAQALGALEDAASSIGSHTRTAGLTALRATAAADVAGLVTTAVGIARMLPAPLAVDTPQQLAEVVRHFAALGVARAGGSPVSTPAASSLIGEIASRLPPALLAPMQAAEQLLPLIGEGEAVLDAPREGAQMAYQSIVGEVERALIGKSIVIDSGRRKPLVRTPDSIDISPLDESVVAGGWALLSVPTSVELYRITRAAGASRAEYLLSGQTTRLTLSGELPGGRLPAEFEHAVRALAVHVRSEALTLARVPLPGPVYGDTLALDLRVDGLVPGQALALSGKRQRIEIARGHGGATWTAGDGSVRTLQEGDSLLLAQAPVRLVGSTAIALDPDAFAAAVGMHALRLRLTLQDRDGVVGEAVLRGDDFALGDPLDDDPEVAEIVFIADTADAISQDRDRSHLRLATKTRHVHARRWARINANVAPATHGETVEAILGSGDGSVANARFALNQAPLTFVSASTPSGRASTLELRVDDVLWSEVPTLYAQPPDGHVFATRQSDTAVTTIQFGDGLEGARLPSGESNLRVKYRKGLGVAGNVAAGKLTTLLSRPLGVSAATNPEPASGGEDAETLARARDNAPLTVLTLERVVSIDDYANFARAFAGIDKAHALWIPAGPAQGVFLSIAGVDGAEVPEGPGTFDNLADALASYGDPLVPLRMRNYRDARFRCRLSVRIVSTFEQEPVLAAVEAALREHFGFASRAFGQTVSVDELAAVAQGVAGVEAVHVTRLHRSGTPPQLVPRLFAALPVASLTAIPEPAELLTLDDGPLELEVLP